jgi:RNA polymerase sigma-70 factor, ECF subfamily
MPGAPARSCSPASRTAPPERAYTGPMTASHRSAAADAALVDRLATDETGEAMRELYRLYGGELFGFALNALGDRGAAEEIVQEVFLRAWRHARTYDPRKAAVRTWLYQITRHAIIDARRRASVRPGLPRHKSEVETEGGPTLEQSMLGWQVAAALERLTPEHRQMIRLAHFQGLSVREIADQCELPIGTVKSRTWYALRSLRLVLEEMGVVP